MSSKERKAQQGLISRVRRSVATRLSLAFALLFTVGFTAIFGVLYWLLGRQLEQRDIEAIDRRLHQYAQVYNMQGIAGLNISFYREGTTLMDRPLYIHMVFSNGNTVVNIVPSDWVVPSGQTTLIPDGWGGWTQQEVFTTRIPRDQEKDLIVLSRTMGDGSLLQVGSVTNNRSALLEPLRRTFLWVAGAVVLVAFVIGWFAARRAVKPLQGVVDTARRIITTGALDARVAEPRRDNDIAELVRLFNTVLDKNAGLLRSMREALDNVAHDLRTPLTSMRGSAELALASGSENAMRDALADNVERSDEVLRLLRALMEISEADAGMMKLKKEPCDLNAIAASAIDLYSDVADARGQKIQGPSVSGNNAARAIIVSGDSIRLRQVIANLLDNALKYTPEGGCVGVETHSETRENREGALLTVADNGPGVPEAEQSRIWERLYRGDQSRSQSGLGLGLSLVRAIVEAHGGAVSVRNAPAPDHGAIFAVWLPKA